MSVREEKEGRKEMRSGLVDADFVAALEKTDAERGRAEGASAEEGGDDGAVAQVLYGGGRCAVGGHQAGKER